MDGDYLSNERSFLSWHVHLATPISFTSRIVFIKPVKHDSLETRGYSQVYPSQHPGRVTGEYSLENLSNSAHSSNSSILTIYSLGLAMTRQNAGNKTPWIQNCVNFNLQVKQNSFLLFIRNQKVHRVILQFNMLETIHLINTIISSPSGYNKTKTVKLNRSRYHS